MGCMTDSGSLKGDNMKYRKKRLDKKNRVTSISRKEKEILQNIFDDLPRKHVKGEECVLLDDILDAFRPYIKECNNDYSEFSKKYPGLYDAWWPIYIQCWPEDRQKDLQYVFRRA